MPTIRQSMGWGWRLKMIGFGGLTAVGCFFALPHVTTDAAQTFLGAGVFFGALSVIGGFIGLQDHKF